jgi:hypothetical protein
VELGDSLSAPPLALPWLALHSAKRVKLERQSFLLEFLPGHRLCLVLAVWLRLKQHSCPAVSHRYFGKNHHTYALGGGEH